AIQASSRPITKTWASVIAVSGGRTAAAGGSGAADEAVAPPMVTLPNHRPQYRQKRSRPSMTEPSPRFRVVPSRRIPDRTFRILLAVAWLASLVVVALVSTRLAAPGLANVRDGARTAQRDAEQRQRQLEELGQRVITLERSDQISRAANIELQASLAERDEEIAGLRADVA